MNKKILATILLLVATLAFAADKYISSSGDVIIKTATSKKVNLNDTLYTTQAGKVGIGTAIPATILDAALDVRVSSGNNMGLIRNSSDANGPNLIFKMTRGTETTPTIVQTGDALGGISFYGATGVSQNILPGASINAVVDGTVSTIDVPAALIFSTTLDGSSGTTERMRIGNNGNVTLNGLVQQMSGTKSCAHTTWVPILTTNHSFVMRIQMYCYLNNSNIGMGIFDLSASYGTPSAVTTTAASGVSGYTLEARYNDTGYQVEIRQSGNGNTVNCSWFAQGMGLSAWVAL